MITYFIITDGNVWQYAADRAAGDKRGQPDRRFCHSDRYFHVHCKRELVQKFLEETYSVLSQSESFYRKFRVHIIQCDERVQSDVVVTNAKELQDYMDHFTIRGLGGTDFRPVFTYVNRLLAEKKFTKLKGLLYFTDGYGRYPLKKPPYDTAFVFLKEDYLDVDVPPWAIKLILGEEDLEEQQ